MAQPSLARADSLFAAKQYTQSLDAYENVYQRGWQSPAMLLRMAFINEGLGNISNALFYLQRYQQLTHDEQALQKIEELAARNRLEGYTQNQRDVMLAWLHRYEAQVTMLLASLLLFTFALTVYQSRKQGKPVASFIGMAVVAIVLLLQTNWLVPPQKGIIAQSATPLMSGPSSAADVVAVVGAGHQLTITGKQDVWLRVQWRSGEAYIKENKLMVSTL